MNYDEIIQRLLQGNPHITEFEKRNMNIFVNNVLSAGGINPYLIPVVCKIITICNIIYNNAPNKNSPLSDNVYDRLIVLCKRQNIEYPIGSPPVQFFMEDEVNGMDLENREKYHQKLEVMRLVDTSLPYFQQLVKNHLPIKENYIIDTSVTEDFKKRRIPTTENNLCGTLEKCKYVLNQDAEADGLFQDPTINIFERDFLYKHIQLGIVDPNNIQLIATLKYDGISVECTIEKGIVTSAYTRGDTDNGESADLTPIFYGLRFPRCNYMNKCNVKFEVIITDKMLEFVRSCFQKTYVNPRNAVIGLLGGLDARKYRDIVTPVPLESDIVIQSQFPNQRRYDEIELLNNNFTKSVDLRSVVIQGNVNEVLYKLKEFTTTADKLRGYMGFWYDGIVVEYLDDRIRSFLGKKRSIPNYAIAIKFPPLKAQSVFTHYTFSVGQTGIITPKAHFLPVHFMGQVHDKASVHSLRKVNEFQLRAGDKVNLVFSNDVMVYLTPAPYEEQPKDNMNPIETFPTTCPSCGSPLMVSESGDTAYCPNFGCPERMIARMTNFLAKLNIKGFSKETIRLFQIHTLRDLLNITEDKAKKLLGKELGVKFVQMVQTLLNTEFVDYRILGAIGFTGCGSEVWKKILRHFPIEKLVTTEDKYLYGLENIKGIGINTVRTILTERRYLMDDLNIILSRFHLKKMDLNAEERGQVRFTGIRDQQLSQMFQEIGFSAGEGSVTNKTTILIVPMMGYQSGSVNKAFELLNKRLVLNNPDLRFTNYNDIPLIQQYQLYPMIMTVQQAYDYINYLKGEVFYEK